MRYVLLTIILLAAASPWAGAAGRFALDTPIWSVDDQTAIDPPAARTWNRYQGFIDGCWRRPLDDLLALRERTAAADVNALEEVPASSWFTPRNGVEQMSPAAVGRGCAGAAGLERGTLSVTAARLAGPEPYLQVVEPSGAVCRLEFDDPRYPEMRSAAAVIAGRLLHAAGYHVLPSFIADVDPADLEIAAGARRVGEFGASGELREEHLREYLAGRSDGGAPLRVAVSRLPGGKVLGPSHEKGTRYDDPNDRIAHEDRRSLRGLQVLAAWLDFTRVDPRRTLDIYLEPEHYVRHYLVGLGAALGAWAAAPHPWGTEGHESYWQMGGWLADLPALGFGKTARAAAGISPFLGVGACDAGGFDPVAWQPAHGFAPFQRAGWGDLFWGARLVSGFTNGQIRAAVEAGRLGNAAAEAYLAGTLIARRDRVTREWFGALNAADEFHTHSPVANRWRLLFADLGIRYGQKLAEDVQYLMAFGLPETGETLGYQSRGGDELAFDLTPFVPAPWLHRNDPRRYGIAAIRSYDALGRPLRGEVRVHVYFDAADGPRVVGIER